MRQKRSHLGCLFWVALILLVIVVFLFNRPKIEQVLRTTGLTGLIAKQTSKPSGLNVTRLPPASPQKKTKVVAPPSVQTKPTPAPSPVASPNQLPSRTTGGSGTSTTRRETQPTIRRQSETPPAPAKVIHQKFDLYFVKIGSGGKPTLEPVSTTIDFIDSPLTRTFDSLLQGAPAADRSEGVQSLIPRGTKLLAASVRGGTAYLDFNDSFRFNAYGVEGYHAQLEQVVFTATQFPTVQRVQILLNGKVRRFLASEGIAIDKPLERSSFSR